MRMMDSKSDYEIANRIAEINQILSLVRAFEYKLTDGDIFDEVFEDYIISVKVNLKSIKTSLITVDDINRADH